MTPAEKVLSIAKGEIGTKEQPANSNKVKYNTWYYGRVVSGSDYPWCMVFAQWVYERAGLSLPYLTASCGSLLNWYKRNDPVCVVGEPEKGCLAIFDFSGKRAATSHVGIVESWTGTTVTTIDGNTGTTSEANGGAVMRRTRNRKYVTAYIKPRELEPPHPSAAPTPSPGGGRQEAEANAEGGKAEASAASVQTSDAPEKAEEEDDMDIGKFLAQLTPEQAYQIYVKAVQHMEKLPLPTGWNAEGELAEAVELGITDGLRPMVPATRLETAVMCKRAVQEG